MDCPRADRRCEAMRGLGLSTSMPDLRRHAVHRRHSSAGTEEYDGVTTCTVDDAASSTGGSSVTGGSQRRWVGGVRVYTTTWEEGSRTNTTIPCRCL
jgi:hypothetical protein